MFLYQRLIKLLKGIYEHLAYMIGVNVGGNSVRLQKAGEMVVHLIASAIVQATFLATLVVILLLGFYEVARHGRTAASTFHKAA